jgi:subtilisin family serine protease
MILAGQELDVVVDEKLVMVSASGEKMSPIRFSMEGHPRGGGYLTSSVIVSASDVRELKIEDFQRLKRIPFTDAYILRTNSPVSALELAMSLQGQKSVRYAHPDLVLPLDLRDAPNHEPYFGAQWNLSNQGQRGGTPGVDMGIGSAWQVTTGSPDTIVGLLDVGFEQNHKDMVGAWFTNSGEIPGNKKDDDGNGLIDDVSGWNFSTNSNKLIYGAGPQHGTATAGIIGARVNGVGITGVCPDCKVLPVVVSGRVSEDASALGYAVAMGASVLSNSWGYALESPRTDVVSEALTRAARQGRNGKGLPILFAMRNSAVNDCRDTLPDISSHPDVIAISSIDHNDVKVPNSAFGACLAFLGPSSGSTVNGIPATDRPGEAGYNKDGQGNFEDLDFHNGFWGTSAATPNVAGLFALLLTHEPNLTREEALSRMKASAIKANPAAAQYNPSTGHSLHYGFGRAHAGRLFERQK